MTTNLRPVALAFVALGTFMGCWAVLTADLERALGLGHGGFGSLLALALAGTAVTSVLAGALAERFGTALVASGGALAFAAALGGMVAFGHGPRLLLGLSLVVVFASSGVLDVAMNIASAAALAHRPGHLVRFHAFFNAGAAAGAAGAALIARLTGDWRLALLGPMALMLLVAARCRTAQLPAGEVGEHHGLLHSFRAVRRERLVVLAAIFACSAMVEGGIDTWGVLVLRTQLETGLVLGAAAQVAAQVIATASRAILGPAAGALGTTRGIALGGGVAAGGLTLLAVGATPLAVAGLIVAAAGISVCWPMLIAHASAGLDRPAGVVSGVTATGYVGFVVGPAVFGLAADLVGIRNALFVLVALAVLVAVAPRQLRSAPPATGVASPGAMPPSADGGRVRRWGDVGGGQRGAGQADEDE
ncbi:MAG: major facilitator superfamily 1 [Acidimicrobiales bacterium]|nr:major facilitator superfamily 1 [Acidimicrobiales bacterium]